MSHGGVHPPVGPVQEEQPIDKKEKTRLSCIANGGQWDPDSNDGAGNCIFPESQTGTNTPKVSVETPSGDFLGLNKPDADLLRQQQQKAASQVPVTQAGPLGAAQTQETARGIREQGVADTGVLGQTTPQFEELNIQPTGVPGENLPLIGPSIAALQANLLDTRRQQKNEKKVFFYFTP